MIEIKVLASGSTGNCYLIADGQNKLLIECGIPFQKILKGIGFDLGSIQGCLVTHEHKDHSKAILDLLKHGVDVYCSKGTAKACGVEKQHRINFLHHATVPYAVGQFRVFTLNAMHDAAEPLMFVVSTSKESLLFATDTYYIPYKISGLTHVMIECNYDMNLIKHNVVTGEVDKARKVRTMFSHMNIDTLKEFFKANDWKNLQRVILLHLSEQNSDEKKFIEEIEKIAGVPVEVAEKESRK